VPFTFNLAGKRMTVGLARLKLLVAVAAPGVTCGGRVGLQTATLLICAGLVGCSSTSGPSSGVELTGTWSGTASDAGPVRWTIAQMGSTITGTAMLLDASMGGVIVTGSIKGTVNSRRQLIFEQSIGLFQFPRTGQWSQYWEMSFDTTGTLTLSGNTQLDGSYLGSASMIRSPPGPVGQGGPFTNGRLNITKQ